MASLTLTWSDLADNEDGYRIYRAQSSGTTTSDYTQIADVTANTQSYVDSGLTKGETYYYRVEAYTEHVTALSAEISETTTPSSASSFSASGGDRVVDLTWTEGSGTIGGHRVYASDNAGGSSTADYNEIADLAPGTTSYSDTRNLQDGEKYFYRVETYSGGKTALSAEATATADIRAPTVNSLNYVSDKQLDLDVTQNSNYGNLHVQINRDGNGYVDPSGGSVTPANGGVFSYGPDSGNAYSTQVGIDSEFTFRVRAETEHVNSAWVESSSAYTTPIPPHNPSASRSGENTIVIDADIQSDIGPIAKIHFREDTGSGYGSWKPLEAITDEGLPFSATTGTTYQYGYQLQEDARYQFKIQTQSPVLNSGGRRNSEMVYVDYGNKDNVFFEDDFESGDASAWDTADFAADNQSGIQSGSNSSMGISGADDGTYYAQLESSDYIEQNLGDLTGNTDVLVKCAMTLGSFDKQHNDRLYIKWYDGSSWQYAYALENDEGSAYNGQGWWEVTALIPDSWLSSDNRIRFQMEGTGGGDRMAVDRVVVSDLLHEYTKPAAPTNFELDPTTAGEITLTWTDNASLNDQYIRRRREKGDGDWQEFDGLNDGGAQESYTESITEGVGYDYEVYARVYQYRNGVQGPSNYHQSYTGAKTTTSRLPLPDDPTISNVTVDSADMSWTDQAVDEDGYRVLLEPTGSMTGFDVDGNISGSNEPYYEDFNNGSWSMAFRFKIDFPGTNGWQDILRFGGTTHRIERYQDTGELAWWGTKADDSGSQRYGQTDSAVDDGNIHTIVCTRPADAQTVMFTDGAETFNSTYTSSTKPKAMSADSLEFMSSSYNVTFYEAAVFPRALTQTEAQNFHDGTIPDNPRMYFPFNDNNGGTTPDMSGYGNDLTINNATFVGTKNAFSFNAGSEHVDTPDLGNSGGFSISCWFKKTGTGTAYIADGRQGSDSWWFISNYNGSDVNFRNRAVWNGLVEDEWTHVLVAADSNESELFINGSSVDTGSGTTGVLDAVRFGARYSDSEPLNGEERHVQIHNRKLDAREAEYISNGGVIRNGLLAYYPFHENQGGTTPDLANGNDATVSSGVTVVGDTAVEKALTATNNTTFDFANLRGGEEYDARLRVEGTDVDGLIR